MYSCIFQLASDDDDFKGYKAIGNKQLLKTQSTYVIKQKKQLVLHITKDKLLDPAYTSLPHLIYMPS